MEWLFHEFKAWFYVIFAVVIFFIAMVIGDIITGTMTKVFGGFKREQKNTNSHSNASRNR